MIKLKCIIVDDERIARNAMVNYVGKLDELELVAEFRNGLEAKNWLLSNQVDLVFLDINMPIINGLEMLKLLSYQPEVIFTTAYAEHAIASFEFNVVDYLLKPISFERFVIAAKKALRFHSLRQESEESTLTLKEGSVLVKIRIKDILFIEAMQNYIRINTLDGKHMILMTLKEIMLNLPEATFVQTHRSFVVNFDKIEKIEKDAIVIQHHKIPISKRSKNVVLAKFKN